MSILADCSPGAIENGSRSHVVDTDNSCLVSLRVRLPRHGRTGSAVRWSSIPHTCKLESYEYIDDRLRNDARNESTCARTLARGGVDHDAPWAKETSGLALHPQY